MDIFTQGGPAFPTSIPGPQIGGPTHCLGLSRRDWFAGQALPAVLADAMRHNSREGQAWPVSIDEIADKSYRFADAMLAASARVAP